MNWFICIVPPVSSLNIFLSKPLSFCFPSVVQHSLYDCWIWRRGNPRGWYFKWKKSLWLWKRSGMALFGGYGIVVVVVGVRVFVGMEGRRVKSGAVGCLCLLFWFILRRESLKIILRSSYLCPRARNLAKNSLLMLWKSFGFGFCRL